MTPAEIAAKLTKAQQWQIGKAWQTTDGRWMVKSASETKAGAWPQGITEYYSWAADRLTPLGLAVRAHLEKNDDPRRDSRV